MIHVVDGKKLAGFVLGNLIGDVAKPAYHFRVWRPPYDAASADKLSEGIMDTLKLQQVVQGKRTSASPIAHICMVSKRTCSWPAEDPARSRPPNAPEGAEPACSRLPGYPLGPGGEPSPLGFRREAPLVSRCLSKVAHSEAFEHSGTSRSRGGR